MAQSKIKVKIVEFVNNLLSGKPKQYKPALQTPTVVSAEKFIENVSKETGLSKFQANNVLSCIFQTAGDYLELSNAVQLHEDFGTLKPYLKVKAVSDIGECNATCIQGMGLRFIPTGKMRNLLGNSQFVFTGISVGGDVEDSEVVSPDSEDPNGDEQATTYNLTFKHNDEVMEVRQYAEGATVSAPEPPSGYVWTDLPTTMPARDLVVTTVSEGGDSGEI